MRFKKHGLTLTQLDIFLDQDKYPTLPLYNVGGYVEIASAVSLDKFKQAFSQQVKLHDAFYLRFIKANGGIEQYVSTDEIELLVHDFSNHTDPEIEAQALFKQCYQQIFNIEKSILHHSGLIKLGEARYWYYSVSHHLIMDGWAYAIWVKNLIQRYMYLVELDTDAPSNEPISFIENIAKQVDYIKSEKYQNSLQYWVSEINELSDSVLEPKDNSVELALSSRRVVKNISHDIYQQWQLVAEAMNGQVHHLILALLYIYFRRTSGKEVIAIGLPSRNRSGREKDVVGSFVSVRPLCMTAKSDAGVRDIINMLKKKLTTNSRHQKVPLHKIIESIDAGRLNNGRLFDIQFNYQLLDYNIGNEHCPTATYFLSNNCERTPFTFNICEYGEHQDVQLQIDTNDAYFEPGEGELLMERFLHMLEQVSSDSEVLSSDIEIIPAKEISKINSWAYKETTAPLNKRLEQLFDDIAHRYPNKIAVVQNDEQLTYKELEQKSNQLANWINEQTSNNQAPIGLAYKSSPAFIIAMLAVLKAGRAYMPLDRTYPQSRLRQMIELSKMEFALTDHQSFAKENADANIQYIGESQWQQTLSKYPVALNVVDNESDIAYVMFTSGSTGKPKGVVVPHKGIVRLVINPDYISLSEQTRTLLLCKLSFDVSTFEIWAPLLNGGQLVIYPDCDLTFSHLTEVLTEKNVNTLWLTAALFDGWIQSTDVVPENLEYVMAGGDVFSPHSVRKLFALHPKVAFINGYGPTENTTFSTCCTFDGRAKIGTKIPIGQPIAGSSVYVVNESEQLQPIGVVGELLVGGHGLATGYLNAEELTKERFIVRDFGLGSEAVYRTGDLVYRKQDGNIEYVGRGDQQVKVRGFRIELAEIETRLASMDIVKDSAVVCKGGIQLIAFVVREAMVDNAEYTSAQDADFIKTVYDFAQENLPAYMLPSRIISIDALPVTANGKLDRKPLLLRAQQINDFEDYVAPGNSIEEAIQSICQQYLGERVSIKANFFDLGGNSITAMRMVGDITQRLNVEVTTSSIFKYPSVEVMANYIASLHGTETPEKTQIRALGHSGVVPLALIQQQFWQEHALFGETSKYNLPGCFQINGSFDILAFEQAVEVLIERHQVLRTTYSGTAESPVATVNADCKLRLVQHDFRHISNDQQLLRVDEIFQQEIQTPFNLATDKMIRGQVMVISDTQCFLCLTLHHIAVDGWSLNIIFSELELYYRDILNSGVARYKLPALQYSDFSHWQSQYLKGKKHDEHISYWERYLENIPQVHSLPTDFKRPRQTSHQGVIHYQYYDRTVLEGINNLVVEQRTTTFNFLQLMFSMLLGHWGQQDDVVLGTPIAGREQQELVDLVGCFTNTMVLRNNIDSRMSFLQLLKMSHQGWLNNLEHQQVPFDEILSALQLKRVQGVHPVFQIWFVLHDQAAPGQAFTLPGVEIEQRLSTQRMVKFDLMLSASICDNQLCLEWQYSEDLFTADSINKLSVVMAELLKLTLNDPNRPVGELFSLLEQPPRSENDCVDIKSEKTQIVTSKNIPEKQLQNEIQAIWKALFKTDTISATTGFLDAGANALLANEFCNELKLVAGVDIPQSILMGNPTIEQLELLIAEELSMPKQKLVEDSIELEF
ncbi:non-ribosomal peptide synthetase [Pseudoalteromonas prydzensis]|uniref:non-ribosomal peptide synthetase n=1 Tax=Pseudoalteromonas prydzensis TaxID=182141 RepID=UPI0007E529BB|nr:non-ribosomal peptide synthetase [Pseudoalteromonas prydzensis]MBE0377181.1 hypothetical protein [Pseudoalteromonas prydzensis ACAM 620]